MTPPLVVVAEIWRGHATGPGETDFTPVVLRIVGTPTADGWALAMTEQGTAIPWGAEVLTPGERESIEGRLALEARARAAEASRRRAA